MNDTINISRDWTMVDSFFVMEFKLYNLNAWTLIDKFASYNEAVDFIRSDKCDRTRKYVIMECLLETLVKDKSR